MKSPTMKILFIGPQGSGKSTQAKLLAEFLELPYINFGNLLRERAQADTAEARSLRQDMSVGRLIDDEIAARVMKDRVTQDDCRNGFVSDGYARSLHQLSLYDPQFDKVIHLGIDDQIVIDRLLKRAELEFRKDDTLEAIKVRLASYHLLTEPVLERYRQDGIVENISGLESIDQIQQKIRDLFLQNTSIESELNLSQAEH